MRRQYRFAVKAISEGRIEEGFRRIARAAAVVEGPTEERYKALAEDFLAFRAKQKSCLIVSPTWREINAVTDAIRAGLISREMLGTECTEIQALENLDLAQAQKAGRALHFEPDCQLVFHRNCGSINRNAVLRYARHEGRTSSRRMKAGQSMSSRLSQNISLSCAGARWQCAPVNRC